MTPPAGSAETRWHESCTMTPGMGLLGDRRWRLAVEVSILLHLLLIWSLPRAQTAMASLLPVRPVAPAVKQDDKPIRFELVDLPDQKEEKPSRTDVPASDLSRRAHGGEGAADTRPGSRGNTYDLRLAPGARPQVPPRQQAAPQEQPQPERRQVPPAEQQPSDDGASTVLRPQVEERKPSPPSPPLLKGLSPLNSPPSLGGAVPDRKGGHVDVGPLTFDTQWYNWGPYAAEMLRRIRYHWQIPEIAQLGVQGVVRVHFTIERNGRVSSVEIQRESDHPPMDFAARDAIINASPLPPLPDDLTGVEHEGVTITFYYNVRPPDDGR